MLYVDKIAEFEMLLFHSSIQKVQETKIPFLFPLKFYLPPGNTWTKLLNLNAAKGVEIIKPRRKCFLSILLPNYNLQNISSE